MEKVKYMLFEELNKKYDKLQKIYGDPSLHSIYNGGCMENPDVCFVFMNPTGRNIASNPLWEGPYYPWLGTKNIWDLFLAVHLIDQTIYEEIKSKKGTEWTPSFLEKVYDNVKKHRVFITNLGKCTQIDARPLTNAYFQDYLPLLEKEIDFIRPKIIITLGNQVSSLFLGQTISVSKCRKMCFSKTIKKSTYLCFPVYYPIGNGRFNIDKAIEDISYILLHYLERD